MMEEVEAEEGVVAIALDRVCHLESRVRQAVQHVEPLRSSLGGEVLAGERETKALQDILWVSRTSTLQPDQLHGPLTSAPAGSNWCCWRSSCAWSWRTNKELWLTVQRRDRSGLPARYGASC